MSASASGTAAQTVLAMMVRAGLLIEAREALAIAARAALATPAQAVAAIPARASAGENFDLAKGREAGLALHVGP
jgi:hypothetical protein